MREALRLIEKTDQQGAEKLACLRQAWKHGVNSGYAGEIDFAALKQAASSKKHGRKWLRPSITFEPGKLLSDELF